MHCEANSTNQTPQELVSAFDHKISFMQKNTQADNST